MNSEIYFTELRQEHLDQAAAVFTRNFLKLNQNSNNPSQNFEEVFCTVRKKILPELLSGWSFVLMRGHTVIGLSI